MTCPCARPTRDLTDDLIRRQLQNNAGRQGPVGMLGWRADDSFGVAWHVVRWRRCPESRDGTVHGTVRCEGRSGHGGWHAGPPGTITFSDFYDRNEALEEPSWPVPCWVTTAEEAERWRPRAPDTNPLTALGSDLDRLAERAGLRRCLGWHNLDGTVDPPEPDTSLRARLVRVLPPESAVQVTSTPPTPEQAAQRIIPNLTVTIQPGPPMDPEEVRAAVRRGLWQAAAEWFQGREPGFADVFRGNRHGRPMDLRTGLARLDQVEREVRARPPRASLADLVSGAVQQARAGSGLVIAACLDLGFRSRFDDGSPRSRFDLVQELARAARAAPFYGTGAQPWRTRQWRVEGVVGPAGWELLVASYPDIGRPGPRLSDFVSVTIDPIRLDLRPGPGGYIGTFVDSSAVERVRVTGTLPAGPAAPPAPADHALEALRALGHWAAAPARWWRARQAARARVLAAGHVADINRALVSGTLAAGTSGLPVDGDDHGDL